MTPEDARSVQSAIMDAEMHDTELSMTESNALYALAKGGIVVSEFIPADCADVDHGHD